MIRLLPARASVSLCFGALGDVFQDAGEPSAGHFDVGQRWFASGSEMFSVKGVFAGLGVGVPAWKVGSKPRCRDSTAADARVIGTQCAARFFGADVARARPTI